MLETSGNLFFVSWEQFGITKTHYYTLRVILKCSEINLPILICESRLHIFAAQMGYRKTIYNRLLGTLLMLLLFTSYIGCISFFPHNHFVDGHTITHSHPYSGSTENPNHSHTSTQLSAIAMLSTVFFLEVEQSEALRAILALIAVICATLKSEICIYAKGCISLRAPPVM